MAAYLTIIKLCLLASLVSARHCQNVTVPVAVSARNAIYNQSASKNDIEVTNFVLNMLRQGHNYPSQLLEGYRTVAGNYSIAATYCQPDSGPSKSLQILTHGLGFDRSYWDFPINAYNYSYVQDAVDHHDYAVFYYNRLGVGLSSQPDPIQETQVWMESEVLAALTDMAHEGSLPGTNGARFDKTIHVGHSFGSTIINTLTTYHPDISDAIVLTGWSHNDSFGGMWFSGSNFVAANSNVTAFGSADPKKNGYLAIGDTSGLQYGSFSAGDFDPAVLESAFQSATSVTMGELLNTGGPNGPNKFSGSVLIVTGEYDVPFCGGDCLGTGDRNVPSIPAASKTSFPNATNFDARIIMGAGHGLNLLYSHSVTYKAIFDHLAENGLGSK